MVGQAITSESVMKIPLSKHFKVDRYADFFVVVPRLIDARALNFSNLRCKLCRNRTIDRERKKNEKEKE